MITTIFVLPPHFPAQLPEGVAEVGIVEVLFDCVYMIFLFSFSLPGL